jgi:hypothetical protein
VSSTYEYGQQACLLLHFASNCIDRQSAGDTLIRPIAMTRVNAQGSGSDATREEQLNRALGRVSERWKLSLSQQTTGDEPARLCEAPGLQQTPGGGASHALVSGPHVLGTIVLAAAAGQSETAGASSAEEGSSATTSSPTFVSDEGVPLPCSTRLPEKREAKQERGVWQTSAYAAAQSLSVVARLNTILVTASGVLGTWLWNHEIFGFKISFNIPLTVVGFGVFFPLAFVIGVVYRRRDQAALVIASMKAAATGLVLIARDWDQTYVEGFVGEFV